MYKNTISFEQIFKTVMQSMPGLFYVFELESLKLVINNENWKKATGYNDEELRSMQVLEYFKEGAERDLCAQKIRDAIDTGYACMENNLKIKSGELVPYFFNGHRILLHGKPHIIGVGLDISTRLKAEEMQNDHMHFLESLSKIDKAIHEARTLDDMLNQVIETVLEIFKSDRAWLLYPSDPNAEFLVVPVEATVPEYPGAKEKNFQIKMNDEFRGYMEDTLNANEPVTFDINNDKALFDGANKTFHVKSQMIMTIYPKVDKPWLFGIHQCSYNREWTTHEKKLFNEIGRRLADGLMSLISLRNLRKSEEKYRAMVETSNDWIWEVDTKGVYTYSSPQVKNILGYGPEEMVGKNIFEMMVKEEYRKVSTEFYQAQKNNKPIVALENTVLDKDGNRVVLETSGVPFYNSYGEIIGFRGIDRNITERKKAEEEKEEMQNQIFQTSKLASLGELAAGVGHEINNPLAIIQGYLEFISDAYRNKNPELDEALGIMENSVKRIKNIVDGLRTFARKDNEYIEEVNMHKIINDSVMLINSIYSKENIQIITNLNAKNSEIAGNAGKLQQALMNLLSNAKDALSGKAGVIKIETKNTDNKFILFVSDNGSGIRKENLNRIFDTFFTTKQVGKGTGLGLSITHSIVEAIKGRIEVESVYGLGTKFKISFPEARSLKYINMHKPEPLKKYNKLIGKALIVDDEKDLRTLLSHSLKRFGLNVDTAHNTETAIKKLNESHYDYMITDLKMPGLRGEELICMVRKNTNKLKIIAITGGILDDYNKKQRDILESQLNGFIKKPFKSHELYDVLIKSNENSSPLLS